MLTPHPALRTPHWNDAKGLQALGVGVDRREGSFRRTDETFHVDESGRACGQSLVSEGYG